MKKLSLLLFMATMSMVGYSQITLLKEIEGISFFSSIGGIVDVGEFSNQYYLLDDNKITIYDYDLNVVKTINVPSEYTPYQTPYKNVYTNSDKYEYFTKRAVDNIPYFYLFNEDGKLVHEFGDFAPWIVSGNKLITYKSVFVNGAVRYINRIYKIHGIPPTEEVNVSGVIRPIQYPFPNPAAEIVNIPYSTTTIETLVIYDSGGNVVDSVTLDPQATNVQLPTVNFAKGVYFYQYGAKSGKFLVK